jgi:hypothetical protein
VRARCRGIAADVMLWAMMIVLSAAALSSLIYVVLGVVYPQAIHHNHTHELWDFERVWE